MSPFFYLRSTALPLWLGLASVVHAAPLSFTAALELAERQSPKLAANAARIDAARMAGIPAGALPNPKLFAGIDNAPVSGPEAGHLRRDFMTMQKVGVMQDVPHADKRRAREALATASVEVVSAQRQVERLSVRRDTALAWLDLYYLQRKQTLFDELERDNALLASTVKAQIASGRGQAADVVAPQQEAAQLADRRDDLVRSLIQARSKLRQWVGTAAEEDPQGDAPLFAIDAQRLRQHLHQHPELLAYAAETRKAEAEVLEAQAMKKPDWAVEWAYQHRASQFGDMVSIQFTFELPISPSTRQDPLIAARQNELKRLDAEREGMLRDHRNELESSLAQYAALTRQLERAKQMALSLAEQKVALQTASYQAGKVDLNAVLAARRERIDQRLRIVELEAQQAAAAARLHYAYGEDER